MADTIQLRRDTAANWVTANPVLHDGEIGIETDTRKRKCGNGTTAWNSLPYMYSDDLDQEPTANSHKPVESGGAKAAIDAAEEIGLAALDAIGDADNVPTEESTELVRSGGVWEAIRNNGKGAFDISAYKAVGGVLAKFDDLAQALGTNGANVPAAARKPGMSVCFVLNSDNKYVQYRLMSDTFNTVPTNWQGVDDEPTAGSNNLVKSGGVEGSLRPLFSNMIDLALTAIIPSGSRLVDINLNQAYQTAASSRTLIFVDRPELVQDVRVFRADLTYVLTNITDHVTGNVLSESNEEWTMIRVVLTSNVAVDTPIRLNFCDAAKVSIPANYFKLKELPDINASITKLGSETETLYNNNYCYVRKGATATLNVSGTTATLSAGDSNLVLVYQTNQIVALAAGESVSFTIFRDGVLYYIVYSLTNNQFELKLYYQMRAENNEIIIGSLITSPASDDDAVFDYYGFYGITVNGVMSCGNSLTSKLAQSVNRALCRLSLAKVIPVVKGNRLEIFRNSISTEVHPMYDLQIVPPASDGYGRFRSNGYIFDSGAEDNNFSLTFNLVDYMAQNTVSSIQTMIKPVAKKSSPSSNKNILVVGDSYTYINTWLQELSRRLKGSGGTPTADGLTNLTFIGTVLHAASGTPVPCEGRSGQDYTYFVGSNSPFYYNGAVNIGSYASAHGYESIDMVLILLGCNGSNPISDVRTLIQSFVTYNPNIKIIVGSNAMKYNQWGWQNTGLRAGMKSSVWKDWYNWNSSVEKLIEDEFSENVFYIDIPAQIDIDNNFQFEEGDANNRNSQVQIRYGLNNVHPAESAYYQIADAFYNAFHYWCLT